MDRKSQRLLEFEKIRNRLVDLAQLQPAKEMVEALEPSADIFWVKEAQAETAEALMLLWRLGELPLGGVHDVRDSLHRADIGLVLDPGQLLAIAETVGALRKIKRFLGELPAEFPIFREVGEIIEVKPALETEIRKAVNENAEIMDNASPALGRIRSQIRTLQNRVHDRLQSLVTSSEFQRYLQEALVTLRGDRYVIPVKREFKAQVPGVVHDQSASGATVFVEPMAVVELNNQLRQAMSAEGEEIQRILSRLSGLVAVEAELLGAGVQLLGRLDFFMAKGRLAREQNGVEPKLNSHGFVYLRRARHPLLVGDVVPIDVQLGREFGTLVITGPNTGGKTVTLKTVGLLTLMAQTGLHIPANEGSEVAVFSEVFADIGDEQSIEQSLSTFSAHMTNIVRILGALRPNSLVLLDELGAGTDPVEGAALAMALLEHLHNLDVRTVATTHYSELKAFAYSRPGVENASVEFDVETLSPTYRLLVGIPGKSNAFEIASRLGLSGTVIDRARDLTSRENVEMEDVLKGLAENRRVAESERLAAETLRQHRELAAKEYEQRLERMQSKEAEILSQAREQAEEILTQTRREVDRLLGELRRQAASKGNLEETVQEVRQGLARQEERVSELPTQRAKSLARPGAKKPRALRPGDRVRVVSLDAEGTVLAPPTAAGEVAIQAGILKVNVKIDDVELVEEKPEKALVRADRSSVGSIARTKTESISPELDLRGQTVEDAWDMVLKYLDDAVLAGLAQVRLIHGKGTGALRQGLRERLKTHRDVTDCGYAGPSEGGDGVTVVRLQR